MLLCDKATIKGKTKQVWCDLTMEPCFHTRYCGLSMKYYQTDAAKKCKVKERNNGQEQ